MGGVRSIVLGLVLAACLAVPADAAMVLLPGATYRLPVLSVKERRYSRVVAQQYDFSCGSAAVATLLSFGYGHPTSEQMPFQQMYARGDQDTIRKVGFSLLDMRQHLVAQGYDAEGFKADLDAVTRIGLPAITLITTGTYHHFVVLRGARGDHVLIADPSRGLRTVPRVEFEKMWTGVLLLVRNHADTGRAHFNDPADWALVPRAPLERAMDGQRGFLAEIFLNLPLANEF